MNIRIKELGIRALVVVVAIVVSIGIMEIAARAIFGTSWPERMPLARVKADREIGWVMLPNDLHYTYEIPVQLNSLGLRGREVGAREPDEVRILAIGDSHLYGQGVGDLDLLTAVAERALNSSPSRCKFRVINAGVRAYSINNYFAAMERLVPAVKPDKIVVFLYANDFDLVDIDRRYRDYAHLDWYMFDISGKPEGDALRQWEKRQWLRRSTLLMLVNDLHKGFTAVAETEQLVLAGTKTPAVEAKIAVVESYLSRFVASAAGNRVDFMLAMIASANQVAAGRPAELYQSRLGAFAARNKVPTLDLLAAFHDHFRRSGRLPLIPYDGHYDAQGQRIMGETVATWLRSETKDCPPRSP